MSAIKSQSLSGTIRCRTDDMHGLRTNIICMTVASLLIAATRFSTNWLVAWAYGPAEHGRFAVVFQLVSMLVVISQLGLVTTFGPKQIALTAQRNRSQLNALTNRLAGILLLLHGMLAVALIVLGGVLGERLGVEPGWLRYGAVWLVGFAFFYLTHMIAAGLEVMRYAALTSLIFCSFWMAWVVVSLVTGQALSTLVGGLAVALGAGGLVCWLVMAPLLRRNGIRLRPLVHDRTAAGTTICQALPYALPQMGTLILPGILAVLLAMWQPSEQVSYFQICFSLGILVNLVAVPMSNAMLPTFARLVADGDASAQMARRYAARGVSVLVCVGILSFVVYMLFGRSILGLISDAYRMQVGVLWVIASAVALDACRMLLDQLLMAQHRVRLVAQAEVARYIVLLVVAWWCIPQWGAWGAAWAMGVSVLVNLGVKSIAMVRSPLTA